MAQGKGGKKKLRPEQTQPVQPGRESKMTPAPKVEPPGYRGSYKLAERVALITGGDSGIGRAVAVLFAKEGADVVITYLNEHDDARETCRLVEKSGRKALALSGDIGNEKVCQDMVQETVRRLGGLDVLVNNAAEQHPQEDIQQIS